MDFGSTFLAILTGLGLSVACGLRVFMPMLVTGIAAQTGYVELGEGFIWLGELPALVAFSIATMCEFILFKFPVIAEMLDVVETPLAAIAGIVLSASMGTDMDPLLRWSLVAIGGGSAGALHLGTAGLKGISSAATVGMSVPLFSTAEDAGAVIISILAILLPVSILFLFPVLLGIAAFVIRKWIIKRRRQPAQTPHSL